MSTLRTLLLAASAAALLSGCSALDRLTGKTDNTVLPGQREDAIPGRTQFPEKQDVAVGTGAGDAAAPGTAAPAPQTQCAANDPACKPPATTGDTFKDPQ